MHYETHFAVTDVDKFLPLDDTGIPPSRKLIPRPCQILTTLLQSVVRCAWVFACRRSCRSAGLRR